MRKTDPLNENNNNKQFGIFQENPERTQASQEIETMKRVFSQELKKRDEAILRLERQVKTLELYEKKMRELNLLLPGKNHLFEKAARDPLRQVDCSQKGWEASLRKISYEYLISQREILPEHLNPFRGLKKEEYFQELMERFKEYQNAPENISFWRIDPTTRQAYFDPEQVYDPLGLHEQVSQRQAHEEEHFENLIKRTDPNTKQAYSDTEQVYTLKNPERIQANQEIETMKKVFSQELKKRDEAILRLEKRVKLLSNSKGSPKGITREQFEKDYRDLKARNDNRIYERYIEKAAHDPLRYVDCSQKGWETSLRKFLHEDLNQLSVHKEEHFQKLMERFEEYKNAPENKDFWRTDPTTKQAYFDPEQVYSTDRGNVLLGEKHQETELPKEREQDPLDEIIQDMKNDENQLEEMNVPSTEQSKELNGHVKEEVEEIREARTNGVSEGVEVENELEPEQSKGEEWER